jgi:hypothetical protein
MDPNSTRITIDGTPWSVTAEDNAGTESTIGDS